MKAKHYTLLRQTLGFFRFIAQRVVLGAALIANAAVPAASAAEPTPEEKLFDQPLARQELDAIGGPSPSDALRCYWYGDMMIRETQTDSPATGPSYVVYPGADGARPACRGALRSQDINLHLENQTLLGRKGPYLIYETTDASGAEPFIVLHMPEGRQVYADQKSALLARTSLAGLHAVTLEGETLRLRYLRAYDASCSLLKDGAACWSKSVKEGHFARVIATQPPPVTDCVPSYKATGAPESDASTIVYDVEITVSAMGKSNVVSRGPFGCLPAP